MHINEQGSKITNPPRFFFTGAEKIYEHQRAAIEKAFSGIQILETYSFSEEVGSMRRCSCGNYHEDFEFGHFEYADPTAKTGKLLAMGFRNFGMPFIRYEIGDMATIAVDALALCSSYEGMLISLIEALGVGTVPICTPVGRY